VLIVDTAGRLQNKSNLMNELSKMRKVIDREAPGCLKEVLLVLDATTGQNAISQAKIFGDATGVTGVVLTKLDGTAKGGVVIGIRSEFDLPVKLIGTGEAIDNMEYFDAKAFGKALFSDEESLKDKAEEIIEDIKEEVAEKVEDLKEEVAELKQDAAEFKANAKVEMAELKQEVKAEAANLKANVKEEVQELKEDVEEFIADVQDDIADLMDGQRGRMLFTSPPYSDMREYEGGKDLSVENLSQFIAKYRPYTDYQCVNLGIQRKDNDIFEYWNEYIKTARENGYKMLSWNVWDKGMTGNIGQAAAFFPLRHEWVFVFGTHFYEINLTVEKKPESITNNPSRKNKEEQGRNHRRTYYRRYIKAI
jgi:fused signal recognition particle receptor